MVKFYYLNFDKSIASETIPSFRFETEESNICKALLEIEKGSTSTLGSSNIQPSSYSLTW